MSATELKAKTTKTAAISKLNPKIFGIDVKNHELIQSAYTAYLANGRVNLAKTLKRGEVSGGGKKPWKQKGTGRARFGSSRVPIWRGGGITFGPSGNENYTKKISTVSGRTALRQALSIKAKEHKIIPVETFNAKEGKVKQTLLQLTKFKATGNVLLVVSVKDKIVERATNNLPNVKAVQAGYLNVYDVMNADTIVISQKSLAMLDERLGSASKVRAGVTK